MRHPAHHFDTRSEVMPACGFPNMTEWPEALGLQADRLVDQLFPTKENQVQDGLLKDG